MTKFFSAFQSKKPKAEFQSMKPKAEMFLLFKCRDILFDDTKQYCCNDNSNNVVAIEGVAQDVDRYIVHSILQANKRASMCPAIEASWHPPRDK